MKIKEFYLSAYPSDDAGHELNNRATFPGLLQTIDNKMDVYEFIGCGDSLVRDRLFEELANQTFMTYNEIYQLWLLAA